MSEQTHAQPVNWEAVKMLALQVGVREAARRLGLSEERVKKRCTLDGWLSHPSARAVAKAAVQHRNLPVPQSSPSAVMMAEIAQLGGKTRLGHARAAAGVAERVAARDPDENLADAQNVKAAAQTANMIFGWADQPAQVRVRLDILGQLPEIPAIEVESEVIGEWEGDTVE